MYNFDSLSLKYFYLENKDFISGSIVQKIQLPSRHEIILNNRNLDEGKNKKLYININPKYPHICFIDEKTMNLRDIKIPKSPPMFCMQLRKYLNGSKIKDFNLVKYERILELYFDYFDEIGSLTQMCLALEFMGKHSNIILYNSKNKIIIGSIHNISQDKSSIREIYGGINYIYPPQKQKLDILQTSYSTFYEIAKNKNIKEISNNFYYFNQALLSEIFKKFENIEDIFSFLQNLQNYQNKEFLYDFWGGGSNISEVIDNYFSNIMFFEILDRKKQKLKKYLTNEYKKLQKTTQNELDYSKVENYKNTADLIMSYIYQIKTGDKELRVDKTTIELDTNLTPSDNAQKYYALYKKAKISYEHNKTRVEAAKIKLEYFESIIFNIENAADFETLEEIKNELIEIGLIENTKKEDVKTNLTHINYKGWDIYIGKNNKQNDYLVSKVAKSEDLWFHGQNFPSSHVILKIPNNKKEPKADILEYCAKLTKENSKAKTGGKAPIIYTKRKNLKKPPDTYLGYVTYKNEKEIVI